MARAKRNRRKQPRRDLPKLPRLPRLSIDWRPLVTLAAVAGIGLIALMFGRDMFELPVRSLEIEGSFQRVSRLDIAAAAGALGQNFLSLDLDAVRDRIAGLAWVDKVTLRRVWPDTLKVSYTEHRAAARWGETGLLNTSGELFADDDRQEYFELPRLDGPEGSSRRVAERYLELREGLAGTGFRIRSLSMDARGAFTVDLEGGLVIRIGRDDVEGRIARLFDLALPALRREGKLEQADYLDMRYPNGFAVGWRHAPVETQLARLDSDG